MKINLQFPLGGLFLAALYLQSCAIDSTLLKTEQQTITHEHRVHLPAAMYTPGASNTPMFEKQGELSLSMDYTQSGEDSNDDKNNGGSNTNAFNGISHQTAASIQTFSAKGGYALTDKFGIIGSVTFGSDKEKYTPYIESWNIQQSTYQNEYWVWLPSPWDAWDGVSWTQTDEITNINSYEKVGKDITRSYRYFDAELGVGRFSKQKNWKTEIYGGFGFAQNIRDGHLDRGDTKEVYGHHTANFYKIFAQPAIAYSVSWFEAGAALKTALMQYRLKETEAGDRHFDGESNGLFTMEPSLFLRIGPRALRFSVEQKWLVSNAPFPANKSYLSLGIVSTFGTKH